MIDVDNIVALVGATENLDKTQIEKERAIHAQLKIVERPTPDMQTSLDTPKFEGIEYDTEQWTMDDYVELMDLQEKNPKETIFGMRKFCLNVIKSWNFVDKEGNIIPLTIEGMGKLKPYDWNKITKEIMELAKTSFLS